MPIYTYKAVTKNGLVVKNRVEVPSKQILIKGLKKSHLIPVSVEQVSYRAKARKKQKKNITNMQEVMKDVNTTQVGKNSKREMSTKEKINMYLAKTERITSRDLVIFTQNFYLLKNFVHRIYYSYL